MRHGDRSAQGETLALVAAFEEEIEILDEKEQRAIEFVRSVRFERRRLRREANRLARRGRPRLPIPDVEAAS